ncbi:hypothetical protein HAX54_014073 [Datura stramonium]|uniref:Uncharacterized protein n=1 Tax=Datura stramonium TaxID=4076 RepID=A0ABS8TP99_DATST|nr:hypothetical protein [Datura stramonium]
MSIASTMPYAAEVEVHDFQDSKSSSKIPTSLDFYPFFPSTGKWHAKIQSASFQEDQKANLVRFPASSSAITKDKRGWLLNPISLALDSGISASITDTTHAMRHLLLGAKTVFRVENDAVKKGYAEVIVGAMEVAVAVSPFGTAHALVNVDPVQSTYFMGCQDEYK